MFHVEIFWRPKMAPKGVIALINAHDWRLLNPVCTYLFLWPFLYDPGRGQERRDQPWSSSGTWPWLNPTLSLVLAWATSRCLWSGSLEPLGAGKGCGRPGGAPSKAIYKGPHPRGHYGGGCSRLLLRLPSIFRAATQQTTCCGFRQVEGRKISSLFSVKEPWTLGECWHLHSSEVNVEKWSFRPYLNSNLSSWLIFPLRWCFQRPGTFVTANEDNWHISEPSILSIILFTHPWKL